MIKVGVRVAFDFNGYPSVGVVQELWEGIEGKYPDGARVKLDDSSATVSVPQAGLQVQAEQPAK